MKATKSRLSWFKKIVKEKLPDGEDIFGYAGISKEVLLSSLNESYEMLDLLDEYLGRFETIFLEREIAELYEKASDQLDKEDFNKNPGAFNVFLQIVLKVRSNIK